MVASHMPPTGDLARNSGMCPDQELNQRPFSLQADIQSTEAHQPGPHLIFIKKGACISTVTYELADL